jgi:SAM-dependent methyltransferase
MSATASDSETFERSYWTNDSHYRKYEDYAAALAALRRWYQGLLRLIGPELPAPGRSLDVGCGHGAVVHELLDRGWDAYGSDLSRWMIEQARAAVPARAGRFLAGEATDLPFPGRFDLITCLEVLEHVPDPVAVLSALRKASMPGARLIATTPNLRPLIPWWDQVAQDPTHINVHEPSWWRGALQAAGLETIRVSTFISLPVLWRLHSGFARSILLGHRIGPGVLMVARAPDSPA